jgi:hypothetical protein
VGSDSNVWHQVHAQREDGVAAMFLIRDVVPRADQPKIFVVELPYSVTDLSGQPDATAYRRLSAFQEQWLEPACAALGWTFVAWKCEDGSFFLYLYGAGDPNVLLEKLAPFDGELGFFNDVDADWSEYAALRELVEQAHSDDEDGEHDHHDHNHHDHDHNHHDHNHHDHHHHHGGAPGFPVVEPDDQDDHEDHDDHGADASATAPSGRNGKSRSIAAGSEAAAATHRPLPRTVPARAGRARSSGSTGLKARRGSTARLSRGRATTKPAAATIKAAAATAKAAAATARAAAATAKAAAAAAKPAPAKPAKRAAAKRAAAKPAKRTAAKPAGRRAGAKPRRAR